MSDQAKIILLWVVSGILFIIVVVMLIHIGGHTTPKDEVKIELIDGGAMDAG